MRFDLFIELLFAYYNKRIDDYSRYEKLVIWMDLRKELPMSSKAIIRVLAVVLQKSLI
jgi:hypothetical protein